VQVTYNGRNSHTPKSSQKIRELCDWWLDCDTEGKGRPPYKLSQEMATLHNMTSSQVKNSVGKIVPRLDLRGRTTREERKLKIGEE